MAWKGKVAWNYKRVGEMTYAHHRTFWKGWFLKKLWEGNLVSLKQWSYSVGWAFHPEIHSPLKINLNSWFESEFIKFQQVF
jgi:hypothetical protein